MRPRPRLLRPWPGMLVTIQADSSALLLIFRLHAEHDQLWGKSPSADWERLLDLSTSAHEDSVKAGPQRMRMEWHVRAIEIVFRFDRLTLVRRGGGHQRLLPQGHVHELAPAAAFLLCRLPGRNWASADQSFRIRFPEVVGRPTHGRRECRTFFLSNRQ